MARSKKKKHPCKHEGLVVQKLHCVICADCRLVLYYGWIRKEDMKRQTN